MNKEIIDRIISKIKEYDSICIYRHVFPDPDSYGSQNALKSIIEESFPNKKVFLMGGHSKNLEYIGCMNDNIEVDEKMLAIIVDVSNKERVDNQSFFNAGYVIKIDHHKPFDEPFEDLTWVDTEYSSCSEMILDMFFSNSEELKISKAGRKALFSGIIGDTGRFLYLDNPTEIFKKLSKITYDLNAKDVYSNMYKKQKNELKFLGYVYANFKETENGVAYLKIPNEVLVTYNIECIKVVRMVNALQDCEGIKNWHFFAENNDGKIFCEFRSNGPRVNDIAAKYGGGGHMLAAGAAVNSWKIVDDMIKDFDDNCKIS